VSENVPDYEIRHEVFMLGGDFWEFTDAWYVSNVSIIFDAPWLFLHHLLSVSLHFMEFLYISLN
jgi:hypothetical protein